jgi:antitoxin YefM
LTTIVPINRDDITRLQKALTMNILTFSEARASFKQALDEVCKDHEPTVITRQRGEHVVMISLDDYNSMQETLHLLGSPKNAERLRESIAEFKAGKTLIKDLLKDDATEEGQKQGRGSK